MRKKAKERPHIREQKQEEEEVVSQKRRSERWDGGRRGKERRAGTLATVAAAKEQMALGGVVMATEPGQPLQRQAGPKQVRRTQRYLVVLQCYFLQHQSSLHSLCPNC